MKFWPIAAAVLAACGSAGADSRWLRSESEHFEIFTSAGERDSRETLRQFEKVRGFFLQVLPTPAQETGRTRLMAFGSAKEYEAYKVKGYAAAWYIQGHERDYIVIGNTGTAVLPMAIHEYVHLVTRHSRLNLPPWLNEGIAEVYSTLEPIGDQVLVGKLIPGRMEGLRSEKWSLRAVIEADSSSPLYNEKKQVSALYNVGWALTHMLSLGAEYRASFQRLVTLIQEGRGSVEALQEAYGKTPEMLERELNAYIRGGSFQGSLFNIRLVGSKEKYEFTSVDPIELDLALLDIAIGTEKLQSLKAKYERLAADYPRRSEPEAALGYLLWRTGQVGLARMHFEKAFELGGRSPRLLYDYGRLAATENPEQAARALRALIESDPGHIDARIQLAGIEVRRQKPEEALATLQPVKKVNKDQAAQFFRVLTYAQIESGKRREATDSASRWKQNAVEPGDQEDAERMLATLRRGDLPTTMQRDATMQRQADSPPVLRRTGRSASAEPEQTPPPAPSGLRGDFVELTCSGNAAVLRLQTPQGRKSFLIKDGNDVILEGAVAAKQEFDCGRRITPVAVEVFFEPAAGYEGQLKALRFLPK